MQTLIKTPIADKEQKAAALRALRATYDAQAREHPDPLYREHCREQAARVTGEIKMFYAHVTARA